MEITNIRAEKWERNTPGVGGRLPRLRKLRRSGQRIEAVGGWN